MMDLDAGCGEEIVEPVGQILLDPLKLFATGRVSRTRIIPNFSFEETIELNNKKGLGEERED